MGETPSTDKLHEELRRSQASLLQAAVAGWRMEKQAHAVTLASLAVFKEIAALLELDRLAAHAKADEAAKREAQAEQRADRWQAVAEKLYAREQEGDLRDGVGEAQEDEVQ